MFKNKGFTLIELMVVIVIIGVLAALAIPRFMNASAKAKISEIPTVLAAYDNAQVAYITETGVLGLAGSLVFDPPTTSKWFNYGASTGEAIASKVGYDANPINPVGSLTASTEIGSKFLVNTSQPIHWTNGTMSSVVAYIPNFISGSNGSNTSF